MHYKGQYSKIQCEGKSKNKLICKSPVRYEVYAPNIRMRDCETSNYCTH